MFSRLLPPLWYTGRWLVPRSRTYLHASWLYTYVAACGSPVTEGRIVPPPLTIVVLVQHKSPLAGAVAMMEKLSYLTEAWDPLEIALITILLISR